MGGRVSSVEVAGLTLDAGAESFATRGDCRAAAVRGARAGGRDRVGHAVSRLGHRPGSRVPAARHRLARASRSRPFARDVRRVLGWWRRVARLRSTSCCPRGSIGDDVTVGALASARLGARAAERLLAPVMSGVYSRPLDDLPLDAIAPGLAADVREQGGLIRAARSAAVAGRPGRAVRGIVGGVATLADAVAADAERRARCCAPAWR